MHSEQRQPQGRPGFRIQMGKDGTGSYDLVLKKIELLHRYGVEYNILTVVHGRNVNAVEEIYEDYKRRGWRYLQFIACLEPLEGTRGGQE